MNDLKDDEGLAGCCLAWILSILLGIGAGGIFGWPYGFIATAVFVVIFGSILAAAKNQKTRRLEAAKKLAEERTRGMLEEQ